MKKVSALFYQNANGKKPVREWLLSLDEEDRKIAGKDIKTVEYGWPIGMPVRRRLESKLYEVRSDISHKRIARVLFTVVDEYMILLHGFVKKTQKTPKQDLDLALKRKKDIQWN